MIEYKEFVVGENLDAITIDNVPEKEWVEKELIRRLAQLFRELPTEENRVTALLNLKTELRNLKSPIDDVLDSTGVIALLVDWIDELVETETSEQGLCLILDIFVKLTEVSGFPLPLFATSIDRFKKILVIPNSLTAMAVLMRKVVCLYKRDLVFLHALVIEGDFLNFLYDLIQRNRFIGPHQVGLLFEIMAVVVRALNICPDKFDAVVNDRKICETVRGIVLAYLHSGNSLCLSHVLSCVVAMQKSWPGDYNEMMGPDDIKRMLDLTQTAPEIDWAKTGDIVVKLLKFWNAWIDYYKDRENAAEIVTNVVETLKNQLNIYPNNMNLEILRFFAQVAGMNEAIDNALFCMIMEKANELSFPEKQNTFKIFFLIVKQHGESVVDLGDCEAIWYQAFDVCSCSTASKSYIKEFLVGTYYLFAANEDIAMQVADEEWIEFLEETVEQYTGEEGADIADAASSILYQFYSDTTGEEVLDGPFLPDDPV